jgi:TorA maturation chaperone TorD
LDATTKDGASPPLADVLGAQDAAMARSRAYGFLGDLVARPLDAALLEQVTQVQELESAIQNPEGGGQYSLEDLAAAHYELFGLQVYPFGGVFLSTRALAGGDRVADMETRYRHWGFDSQTQEGQDHLACQLRFMAHLSALELGARASENASRTEEVRSAARSFLDAHILPWALPLMSATSAVAAPLYSEVVTMAVFVSADHRRELGGAIEIAEPEVGPDPEKMLDDSKTSVRDIAEYLLAPSRSGCWISRADLRSLGRGLNVPRGFGNRVQLLSNLLRNAAEYHLAEDLLSELDGLLRRQQNSFVAISTELGVDAYAKCWLERVATTREILDSMAKALPLMREEEEA